MTYYNLERNPDGALEYASGGLADILKGATIKGLTLTLDEYGEEVLTMEVKFKRPVTWTYGGETVERVHEAKVLISQDPEGNGPGALIVEALMAEEEVPA